jgi:hypothetical protein
MKILFRICISFILIFTALVLLWLVKSVQTLPFTSYLILAIGSSINLIAGISLFLIVLYQFVRKTEEFTPEEIRKKFEQELYGIKEEDIERKFLFHAGSFAAFIKRRGVSISRLTKSGEYLLYENLKEGIKLTIKDIMKKYPSLERRSYVLSLLTRLEDPYVGKVLEILAEEYEKCKKIGIDYLSKKSLKNLTDKLKKYVK